MIEFDSWLFLAGLALFIYAFRTLEESLKALAGRPFKKFLQRQTAHPLRAIAGGALVTALLQGSSVVLLVTLSFVGAGVLSMPNALALVLGANLGTTFDSWIIAWLGFRFSMESWSYPILAISLVGLLFFGSNRKVGWWTQLLLGFSLLFIGLAYMKNAFTDTDAVRLLGDYVEASPYWFLPVGFILTVLVQSSFATMAIALSALHAHQLPIEHAAALTVGAELGTSIKLVVSSSKGIPDMRRVAWGNFYFNLLAMAVGSVVLFPLIHLLDAFFFTGEPLLTLVCFISLVNLLVVLICYPVLGKIAQWLENGIEGSSSFKWHYAVESIPGRDSDSSLTMIRKEAVVLFDEAVKLNKVALGILDHPGEKENKVIIRIRNWFTEGVPFMDGYRLLKVQQGEQLEKCAGLLHEELEPEEVERLNRLLRVLRNITHSAKNIKNIHVNLKELSDSANDFLYNELVLIRQRERIFYKDLDRLKQEEGVSCAGPIDNLEENRNAHEKAIQHTMKLLQSKQIADAEASTLLNVHRELYSSHKALLEVMNDLGSIQS